MASQGQGARGGRRNLGAVAGAFYQGGASTVAVSHWTVSWVQWLPVSPGLPWSSPQTCPGPWTSRLASSAPHRILPSWESAIMPKGKSLWLAELDHMPRNELHWLAHPPLSEEWADLFVGSPVSSGGKLEVGTGRWKAGHSLDWVGGWFNKQGDLGLVLGAGRIDFCAWCARILKFM